MLLLEIIQLLPMRWIMKKVLEYGYEELTNMLQGIHLAGRMVTEEVLDAALAELAKRKKPKPLKNGVPEGFVPRSAVTRDIIEARAQNISLQELHGRRHLMLLNAFRASLTALDARTLIQLERATKADNRSVPLARRGFEPTKEEKLALIQRELILHNAAMSPAPKDYLDTLRAKVKTYQSQVQERETFGAKVSSLFQSREAQERGAILHADSTLLAEDFKNRLQILGGDLERLFVVHYLLTSVKTGDNLDKLSKRDLARMKKFLDNEIHDAEAGEHDTDHLEELAGFIDDELLFRDMELDIVRDDITILDIMRNDLREAIQNTEQGLANLQPGMLTSWSDYFFPASKDQREKSVEEGKQLLAKARTGLARVERMLELTNSARYRARTARALRMFNFMRTRKIEDMVREERERALAQIRTVRIEDILGGAGEADGQ